MDPEKTGGFLKIRPPLKGGATNYNCPVEIVDNGLVLDTPSFEERTGIILQYQCALYVVVYDMLPHLDVTYR